MDAQPVEKLSIACFEAVSPDMAIQVTEFQKILILNIVFDQIKYFFGFFFRILEEWYVKILYFFQFSISNAS